MKRWKHMAEFVCEQIAFSHTSALLEYQLLELARSTLPGPDVSSEAPYDTSLCILLCLLAPTDFLLFQMAYLSLEVALRSP